MRRGDFLPQAGWNFHARHNAADRPMAWLDGLDIPFQGSLPGTPLLCYRWADTDRALTDQLELEAEGFPGVVEHGHAAVRYTNPTTGGDVLPTIRAEMHRIRSGVEIPPQRRTGSSVQVFDGSGTVTVGRHSWRVTRGDLFAVPSWQPRSIRSEAAPSDSDSGALDLFRSTDAPIFEALHLARVHMEDDR